MKISIALMKFTKLITSCIIYSHSFKRLIALFFSVLHIFHCKIRLKHRFPSHKLLNFIALKLKTRKWHFYLESASKKKHSTQFNWSFLAWCFQCTRDRWPLNNDQTEDKRHVKKYKTFVFYQKLPPKAQKSEMQDKKSIEIRRSQFFAMVKKDFQVFTMVPVIKYYC